MANQKESCITEAAKVLSTFNQVDLEQYVINVFNKAKEYTDIKGEAAIERAIKEVGDNEAQNYFEKMQLKVNDKAKIAERSIGIKDKTLRLLDVLARRYKNLSNNAESAQHAAKKILMDKSFNIFTADETKFIHDPRNDIEVARVLDNKPVQSETAKGIAKKFNEYINARNSEAVNSGSLLLSNTNKDRFFKTIHDSAKILRGGRNLIQSALSGKYTSEASRGIWKDFIKPLLDYKKTFAETEAAELSPIQTGSDAFRINEEKVDKILDDIFDNITTGKPMLIGQGSGKQEMFFYWKDHESWMRYNQKYGRGSLVKAWLNDVRTEGNKIGLANFFGSNPDAAYNALAKMEQEFNPQSEKTKFATKLTYQYLSGHDQGPVNPNLATFFSVLRGITGSAKLAGRMTFLSLPDIANGIMFAHRYGYNYFGAYGTYLSGLFGLMKNEESRYLAGLFKEITDANLNHMSGRLLDADASEMVNNFNNFMYRNTFMDALDSGNKLSSIKLMARILGDNSEHEYAALNDTAKKLLNKFNLSENEWNAIRRKSKKIGGRKLLAIDSVDELSNDDLRKIYGVKDDRPLYQLRNELHRKVYSMFDVASENSVLTPGAFLRASSKLGTRSGTWGGEILGSVMQFKMYPMEFVDRVLFQGWQDADGVINKIKFASLLFGATLPMSWLSMYMDNHFRGKTMPDWNKMNFSERLNYSKDLLLPGIGLFGSFMDPNNQVPNKLGQMMATPALQLLWEGMIAPLSITEGAIEGGTKGHKKIKNAFKAVGKSIIPGQGLPYVSPYMRQMFGDKPYLQPGQKQKFGA